MFVEGRYSISLMFVEGRYSLYLMFVEGRYSIFPNINMQRSDRHPAYNNIDGVIRLAGDGVVWCAGIVKDPS